jgi:succinate dehydrogenase / fumarate reductase, cytochrome b subunit
VNKKRPVNLDISTIKLPITALVSITHRISGVALLGGILILLWMLDASLASEQSFNELKECLTNPIFQLVLWLVLAALAYHLVMGIRHMLMDFGIGETLEGGRRGATVALILAVVLILAVAGWLVW